MEAKSCPLLSLYWSSFSGSWKLIAPYGESIWALGVCCVRKWLVTFQKSFTAGISISSVETESVHLIQAVIQARRRARQADSTRESKCGCEWRLDSGLELPLWKQVHISNWVSTYGICWQLDIPWQGYLSSESKKYSVIDLRLGKEQIYWSYLFKIIHFIIHKSLVRTSFTLTK